jgi:GH25 family lysozyme M1 (1,4-beta-N-acetylmuramidase)
MRGADIHAYYQRGTNWPLVGQSDLGFFYVQLSRGAGPLARVVDGVTYTPDSQCDGVHSIGRLLGGYHFATRDASPETQAAVFASQVRRFGAYGLPPALDLEDPFGPADPDTIPFGKRFLRALRSQGFPMVAIYGNAYFLSKIQPHTWGVPGLVNWAADYAVDAAGKPAPLRYFTGPLDIRQYSSTGQVPGMGTGFCDLNESDLAFLRFTVTPYGQG